jgi:hypothetical protein
MEDTRQVPGRKLQRAFECNRLEERLWAAAYEQIWPLIRRSLKGPIQRQRNESTTTNNIARRA